MIRARNISILLGLCFLIFFWKLGDIPFYERGEPREGLVVAEMNSSGNLILPRVNGDYIPFKPPLFHWMGVLAARIFGGVNEFSLRLPSALLGTLGVLLTYFAGARLWGERAGLIAGLVLVSNVQWRQGAALVQVDMTLAFFMLAAFLSFFFLYRGGGGSKKSAAGLALLLAFATLAKGPIGIVLPGLAFLVFLAVRRDFAFLKNLHPLTSVGVFLLVAGSWYALALWQGGAAFFFRQLVDENLRTATGEYGRPQPLYYFVPILFDNMAPWSLFFPALALFLYRQRHRLKEGELLYPLIWLITVFVFFSLSSGKRGIYILPLYPAAALLWGAWWLQVEKGDSKSEGLTLWIGYFVATSYLLIISAFFARLFGWDIFKHLGERENVSFVLRALFPPSPLVRGLLLLSSIAILSLFWGLSQRTWHWVFSALALLAILNVFAIKRAYYPSIAQDRTLKPFIERVKQEIDPTVPLLFYRAFDTGAIFYAGRHIRSYEERAKEIKPPFCLLMWEEEWVRLSGSKGLEVLDISQGTGPAHTQRMILVRANEKVEP
jgi:4-amino-4-deoxy-L-arabinose transferase-like glycosyltransferase